MTDLAEHREAERDEERRVVTVPRAEQDVADESRAAAVRRRLSGLRREVNDKFLEIGCLLLEAKRDGHAASLGLPSFNAYVDQVLGMKYRTAKYLMDVYDRFINRLEVPRETVAELGVTKTSALLAIVAPENVQRLIEFSRNHTTEEILYEVRREQAPAGVEVHRYTSIKFGCFEDEKTIVDRAIELAKRESGNERPGYALYLIAADYVLEAEARQADAEERQRRQAEQTPEEAAEYDPAREEMEQALMRG